MQIPILNLPMWLGSRLTPQEIKESDILICDFNGIIISYNFV